MPLFYLLLYSDNAKIKGQDDKTCRPEKKFAFPTHKDRSWTERKVAENGKEGKRAPSLCLGRTPLTPFPTAVKRALRCLPRAIKGEEEYPECKNNHVSLPIQSDTYYEKNDPKYNQHFNPLRLYRLRKQKQTIYGRNCIIAGNQHG